MSSPPKVEYRQLGKCGLRVSVPILLALEFGSHEWNTSVIGEETTFEILDATWELGINTIDMANIYSNGESERIVGKWITQNNIPRERIIIATKCYRPVGHSPSVNTSDPEVSNHRDYINQGGLSRAAIFNAVEASLQRLNLTYIDLFQVHCFDTNTPVEETMKALHDLVQSGKVRYIGASSMRAWQFALMNEVADKHGWTKFVSMQSHYSLLYREEEREMNAYCNYHGIGLIPLALYGGILLHPVDYFILQSHILTPADREIMNRVGEVAASKGVKRGQVALAWVAPKVASPVVDVKSVERLMEGVFVGIELSEEERRYLEEPYKPKPVQGHA